MSDITSRPTHEDILEAERNYMRKQLGDYFALSDTQWEIWRCFGQPGMVITNVKETE